MAYILAKKQPPSTNTGIYGAKWLGTSDPAWIRTDDAANFPDPNPYYAGMSGTPSSPFDTISPWKDLKIVEDSAAGTLVEIPKFYYKFSTPEGYSDGLWIQISMEQKTGFLVDPFHADRGDSKGERNIAYGGRYSCGSNFKSESGVLPKVETSRLEFRTGIHNLGATIWQNDYAMYWTIRMLYLVEFAHWNCQEKIGYDSTNYPNVSNTGYTDNMPYHTGTTASSRTTYGLGCQYRYFEGLWGNIRNWIDGIYIYNEGVYIIKNPSQFSDDGNGTFIGTRSSTVLSVISSYIKPSVAGLEYALYPATTTSDSTRTTYICDGYWHNTSQTTGYRTVNIYLADTDGQASGLFGIYDGWPDSQKPKSVSSRIMKLP